MVKKFLLMGIVIFSAIEISAEVSVSANLFLGRSFSANMARELHMTGPINPASDGDWNGFFSATATCSRAWHGNKAQGIGAYPWWSQSNVMTIGDNSGTYNVDAYQLGLGPITPTTSTIALNPIIYQDGCDFMFYVGEKTEASGVFFKIKSGISSLSINPNLTETNPATAVAYPGGAISLPPTNTSATITNPSLSMTAAFQGGSAQGNYRPMKFGLIDGNQSMGAHLSDTEITAGYNFVCDKSQNNVAVGLRFAAPTGTKPNAIYVLEPVNGRGGYFCLGGYIAGNFNLYGGNEGRRQLNLNFMGNVMHLCTATVMRSYDLTTNGHGSKYLLVADYNEGVYQNSIQNLVNIATIESNSSFGVEGDIAVALSYVSNNFSMDLGYELWGRTKENLTIPFINPAPRYAILGRQGIGCSGSGVDATPSNACQPGATISSSVPATTTTITSSATAIGSMIGNATIAKNRISGTDAYNTAITAQYSAASSKVFTAIRYTWKESECCPYISLAADIESSNISNNALPLWAVALIGGVSL